MPGAQVHTFELLIAGVSELVATGQVGSSQAGWPLRGAYGASARCTVVSPFTLLHFYPISLFLFTFFLFFLPFKIFLFFRKIP